MTSRTVVMGKVNVISRLPHATIASGMRSSIFRLKKMLVMLPVRNSRMANISPRIQSGGRISNM